MLSLEYCAGFFDGEGCVQVAYQRAHKAYIMHVTITNNNRDILDSFAAQFGGRLQQPDTKSADRQGKSAWTWAVHGNDCRRFLREVQPHVIVKRPQVDLALEFPDLEGRTRVTPDMQAKRAAIHEGLMRLKKESASPGGENVNLRAELEVRPDIQAAMDLYRQGKTTTEVADALGIKQATVAYWTRELGVARGRVLAGRMGGARRKDSVLTRPDAIRAREMWESGMTKSGIARELGAKPATVAYWLRRARERGTGG